ncbi:MAG: hypothetical protein N4A76_15765 [Firmicutes bacterium]|jgi:hypothetical protein|nr:hypothetical protein [Bacillota bacterium]
MINLIRSGPKMLVLSSDYVKDTKDYIENVLGGVELHSSEEAFPMGMEDITEKADEKSTFVLVTCTVKEMVTMADCDHVFIVNQEPYELLTNFFNDGKKDLIKNTRPSPRMIIMKTLGNVEKVMNCIADDYNGSIESRAKIFERHSTGCVILFTQSSVNRPVSYSETMEKAVYIDMDYPSLSRQLRINNLKYLNTGLNYEDWFELTIKIYDSYGHYDLHYKRLLYIMEKLELGLILGESWGTDVATVFYSVGVYKLRFFTFLDPKEIKEILLGLEFIDRETRVVDYDLYHKRRKVHWDILRTKEIKKKENVAMVYRNRILKRLKEHEIEKLMEMEEEIRDSRKYPI